MVLPLARLAAGRYAVIYLLVLPAIFLRVIYTLAPIAQTVLLSLTNKTMYNDARFVGLANYVRLLGDQTLLASLSFTLVYTATGMAPEVALNLIIALVLYQVTRFAWLSNVAMLLPWAMAPLLAAIVWKIMLYEDGGILNSLLIELGIIARPVRWLSDATNAQASVITVTVWKNVSWVALILMAGLGAVPG